MQNKLLILLCVAIQLESTSLPTFSFSAQTPAKLKVPIKFTTSSIFDIQTA